MATFKETATEQGRLVLGVLQLWYSFRLFARICESESNFFNISQILILACVASATALKFFLGMLTNTTEALLRIPSAATWWKRAALSGMLLLGVIRLSAAYYFLAVPVFEEWYRYLTICAPKVGYPSLIAMELTVSMAFVPSYVFVAVPKQYDWLH